MALYLTNLFGQTWSYFLDRLLGGDMAHLTRSFCNTQLHRHILFVQRHLASNCTNPKHSRRYDVLPRQQPRHCESAIVIQGESRRVVPVERDLARAKRLTGSRIDDASPDERSFAS